MDMAEKLLQSDEGILLSRPAYTRQYDYIGSMAEKPGGVQDNGGVYLHPAAWKLAADAILKRNDKVEENLKKMLPFDNDYYETKGEPYCMFNCYYLEYHGYRKGTPGQSWRTGTNGWLLQSTVKYIFGLVPELEGLKLNPCIPNSWKECSITKLFRGCTYNIKYIQKGNEHNNRISNIFVNGQEKQFKDNIIPSIEGAALDITVYLDK
jgi:cellobiose phosphorylase